MPHPEWTAEEVRDIDHIQPVIKSSSDTRAKFYARQIQIMNDVLSSYSFRKNSTDPETQYKGWINRILYMQNVIGVPSFVGAMWRHLRSLRKLSEEESGDIHGMLKESENERVHLLLFLEYHKPSFIYRFGMVSSQALFLFSFSILYMINPRMVHRLVADIEIN